MLQQLGVVFTKSFKLRESMTVADKETTSKSSVLNLVNQMVISFSISNMLQSTQKLKMEREDRDS